MDGEFLKTANPQIVLPLIKQIVKLYYIVFFLGKKFVSKGNERLVAGLQAEIVQDTSISAVKW